MDSIIKSQQNMNEAYYYGIAGIIASGSMWLLAGLVAFLSSDQIGIATLIIGGTMIFPMSVLLCKLLGRSGKHDKNNPLAPLAIEGTFWMLLSIPIAVAAAYYKIELFFPAMLLVIGGRYLTFNTLYGNRMFWAFAGALVASGVLLAISNAPVYLGALVGGGVEYLFALIIFIQKSNSRVEA